jgi:hypothetical protein
LPDRQRLKGQPVAAAIRNYVVEMPISEVQEVMLSAAVAKLLRALIRHQVVYIRMEVLWILIFVISEKSAQKSTKIITKTIILIREIVRKEGLDLTRQD